MAATNLTEAGLLRAIVENPLDDTPRLVLADWWEDHGQAERAEFVRVEVELAKPRWKDYDLSIGKLLRPAGSEEWDTLRRRERGLLDGIVGLGVEALPIVAGLTRTNFAGRGRYGWYVAGRTDPYEDIESTFRRGFISSVTLPLEIWIGQECDSCMGLGEVRDVRWEEWNRCRVCRGIGRVDAHGPALVLACPLLHVEASDREPVGPLEGEVNGVVRLAWCWDRREELDRHAENLPGWLFDMLEGGSLIRNGSVRAYNTRDEANAALSRVLLAWARDRAGLPALTLPAHD